VWLLVSATLVAQAPRVERIDRAERLQLTRMLDEAMRRRRGGDLWVKWDGHFLQGPKDSTYVPYTLRLERVQDSFRSVAVSVRVIGWNYVFNDTFGVTTERDGDDRLFRGGLLLRPGRCTVYVAVQEQGTRAERTALAERIVVVPGFGGRELRVSSVVVVERVDDMPDRLTAEERRAYPYALGAVNLVPARRPEFSRQETLTVTFQVYNAKTFEDGRPDVEVQYRVLRSGKSQTEVGSTAPQVFDQDTLPEEFSLKEGYQLTPLQSLPLAQFEPGAYTLQIDVQDHLGNAHVRAGVDFKILH
jgi:hypothetical protein